MQFELILIIVLDLSFFCILQLSNMYCRKCLFGEMVLILTSWNFDLMPVNTSAAKHSNCRYSLAKKANCVLSRNLLAV